MALERSDEQINDDGVAVDTWGADHFEGVADGAVTPGAVVEQGTNDEDIQEATDESEVVLGWASDNVARQPGETESLTTDHSDGDEVVCYRGGKFMAILDNSETVDKGEKLVASGNGRVKSFNDISTPSVSQHNAVCAVYIGEAQASTGSSETQRILCKFVGGGS